MVKLNLTTSERISILRIVFSGVWIVDALFKYSPAFWKGQALLLFIKAKDAGNPSWLNPWFHFWYRLIGLNPEYFAILIIEIESVIALALLLGIARRLTYLLSIPFMFLIWGVGEAFGGPYVAGSTDINAGFIYVLVFIALYLCDIYQMPNWALDTFLNRRVKWWTNISGIGIKNGF